MSLVRVQTTTLVTLTHTFTTDEQLTDAAGTVTVTRKRLDGTAVDSGNATHPSLGTYTYPVSSSLLDTHTVDWAGSLGGANVTVRDYVEFVGGFFFGLAEARDELKIPSSTTTAKLAAKRIQVERECEWICRRAFVPRFERETLSGNGTERLGLKRSEIRAVRAVTIAGVAWSAPDVAALGFSDSGVLTRPGGAVWPTGWRNIVVEYEHGWDYPPEDLRDAALLRLQSLLPRTRSGIPDRTTSFTDQSGTYRLSMPDQESTGIPDVDGTYQKWARKRRAVVA